MAAYFYQINPRFAITVAGQSFRVPKTLQLEKEDVKTILEGKKATVKRRFSDRIETVTIVNLDRLHNEKFMTESEYEEFVAKSEDKRGQVQQLSDDTDEEVSEEVKGEEVVETSQTSENLEVDNTEDVIVTDKEVEQSTEEVATTDITEEDQLADDIDEPINLLDDTDKEVSEEVKDNSQYRNNKKHRK